MADIDSLFNDYVTEHRAGGDADPREYLRRVEGADRDELAALIDGYLVRSPGQAWDAERFEGSLAANWAEGMARSLEGAAGSWPVLLPSLRERARIKRRDLVAGLADALGVAEQTEKVGEYYHRMEQGQLDAAGVSSRVLEALAGLVGSSAEALRQAGEAMSSGGVPGEGPVFARTVIQDVAYERLESESAPPAPASPGVEAEREESGPDEVDRLFTGGD